MRTIEKMMVAAVAAGRPFQSSNTRVFTLFDRWLYVSLWDNNIYCKDLKTGAVSYSCAGWHTVTTASRLRALGLDCHIKNGRIIDAAGVVVPSSLA